MDEDIKEALANERKGLEARLTVATSRKDTKLTAKLKRLIAEVDAELGIKPKVEKAVAVKAEAETPEAPKTRRAKA